MNAIWVSFIVFFFADGGAAVANPAPFPSEMHCEAHMQYAEPGGQFKTI